jgi:hypothetical protein
MAFISDEVFDQGLDYADTNGTRIDITVGEATNYTEATGTYNGTTQLSAGNKTGLNTGATEDDVTAGLGRKVVVPAITDGSVTATQTATHWALTDGASLLIATGALSASQAVTNLNTFSLDAISITIRDAA